MKCLLFLALVLLAAAVSADVYSGVSSSCNDYCTSNSDCFGYLCSKCDTDSRTCVIGNGCGGTCSDDADCDQLGGCSRCSSGICSSPGGQCGKLCHSNDDCPSATCSYCHWPGVCVPGQECNARCEFDSDCNRISNCKYCINNECVAKCGDACEHNQQCEDGCDLCWGGYCVTEPPSEGDDDGGHGGDDDGGHGGSDDGEDDDGLCDDTFLEVVVRVPKSVACVNDN